MGRCGSHRRNGMADCFPGHAPTALTAHQDRQDAAVTALQGDVESLSDQIAALQNSAGEITPEDQALLDGIQARAAGITDKLDALDALTPPAPPPA